MALTTFLILFGFIVGGNFPRIVITRMSLAVPCLYWLLLSAHSNAPCVNYSDVCVPAQAMQQGYRFFRLPLILTETNAFQVVAVLSSVLASKPPLLDQSTIWSDCTEGREITSTRFDSPFFNRMESMNSIDSFPRQKANRMEWTTMYSQVWTLR